jgi:hypothetical protein
MVGSTDTLDPQDTEHKAMTATMAMPSVTLYDLCCLVCSMLAGAWCFILRVRASNNASIFDKRQVFVS